MKYFIIEERDEFDISFHRVKEDLTLDEALEWMKSHYDFDAGIAFICAEWSDE